MGKQLKDKTFSMASALFTPVQQRVLGLLFGQPDRQFQGSEVIRLAESGTGAVHRQLQRLAGAGLLTTTRVGNQKYYQANRQSPLFSELHGLIVKTVGLLGPFQAALAPWRDQIAAAWVYGSVAQGRDKASSDIDVMVVSDSLTHQEAFEALQPAERTLGRTVNPVLMTREQWQTKRARPDSFAQRVAAGPRLFIIGSDDELA